MNNSNDPGGVIGDTVSSAAEGSLGQPLPPYTKLVQEALLIKPGSLTTPRTVRMKEDTTAKAMRKSNRLANRPATTLYVEQQATALLMKKSSFLDIKQAEGIKGVELFCSKLADPMPNTCVDGYREFFGIVDGTGPDVLSTVAVHADY